jgi:hypothetical protein
LDAGEHWQSLRLNMPATSIRDLVIHEDDLVLGTHGRSFWILDNINPLRQINVNAQKETALLKPQKAIRVRWNMNSDTPLPPEEPAGENPPDGAIIDYYLSSNTSTPITLEISNDKGVVVRTYSSKDTLYKIPAVNIPLYWIRPQQILSTEAGAHRFLWDLKYAPLNVPAEYPIAAVANNTAPESSAPWVLPGNYTLRLKVGDKVIEQVLTVKMDPRVKTSLTDLKRQHDLSMICYEGRKKSMGKYPVLYQHFSTLFNILDHTEMAPTRSTEKAVMETQAALLKELNK